MKNAFVTEKSGLNSKDGLNVEWSINIGILV